MATSLLTRRVQKEANKWRIYVQRARLTDFEWLVHSHVKFGGYSKPTAVCFSGQLTRSYTFARSGESTRERQRWRSDQSRSDDISPGCMCTIKNVALDTHTPLYMQTLVSMQRLAGLTDVGVSSLPPGPASRSFSRDTRMHSCRSTAERCFATPLCSNDLQLLDLLDDFCSCMLYSLSRINKTSIYLILAQKSDIVKLTATGYNGGTNGGRTKLTNNVAKTPHWCA